MPSTASTYLKVELQAAGENNNSWGTKANSVFSRLEEGICSTTAKTMAGATITLDDTQYTANEARAMVLSLTGTNATIVIPNRSKLYLVKNAGSGSAIISTGSGTTYTVVAGSTEWVYCNGSNVVSKTSHLIAADLTPYLTSATAASTYLTSATAASTYLTQTNAASTYLTQTNAASTYLTITNAASTYETQTAADALKGLPSRSTTTTTLAIGDRGGSVLVTGTVTDPNAVFATNDVVTIYNNSASSISVAQGTSLTLRLAGTSLTGARTLPLRGICTVFFISSSEAVISGAGLS